MEAVKLLRDRRCNDCIPYKIGMRKCFTSTSVLYGFLISFYSLHCWVSFSGLTEVYYDYCRHFKKQNDIDDLWTK